MEGLALLIGFAVAVAFYFAPAIIAGSRGKKNTGAIMAMNFFLGWTLIGWVMALVWALTHEQNA